MQTRETMTVERVAPDAPKYMTIKQAGELLGLRSSPVAQLVKAGEIRAVRFGTLTLVSAYDVAQLGGVKA